MASREQDAKLEELRAAGKKIYSISRLNTYNQCPYQYYLNYVKHIKGKNIGIYGILGGKCHDVIEGCILGTHTPEDLSKAIIEELDDCEMMDISFPLDRNGNSTIKDNWVANMTKFSSEFTTPKGNFDTEELLILPIDEDHYMMGYADAIRHNSKNPNKVWLIDWKTSSQFTKQHLIEAGRQLILYKLALENLGYEVEKCSWCMMKYCETTWIQKNGKPKTKVSEWRNMIKDLENPIMKTLSDLGIDEIDSEIIWRKALDENSWKPFPQEIKDKFKTKIYVRDYDITDELVEETLNYIKETINKCEEAGDDEILYSACDCSKESYFCNALCNFGGKSGQCKYWIDFCATFEKEDDDFDLF